MKQKLMKKGGFHSLKNSGRSWDQELSPQADLKARLLLSQSENGSISLRVPAVGLSLNTKREIPKDSSSEQQQRLSSIAREGLYSHRILELLAELKKQQYS